MDTVPLRSDAIRGTILWAQDFYQNLEAGRYGSAPQAILEAINANRPFWRIREINDGHLSGDATACCTLANGAKITLSCIYERRNEFVVTQATYTIEDGTHQCEGVVDLVD